MFAREIKTNLLAVLEKLDIFIDPNLVHLEHPSEPSYGDYATNVALLLAESAKKGFQPENKDPTFLAQKIKSTWESLGLPDFVERIEVAGPGFINIWLKFEALSNELVGVIKRGDDYGSGPKIAKTLVIDYSAPNIAKPFGIGHLRSTNIGQAIYNIYKFLGWRVIGDNHLGDWGTQFGKLIYQIKAKIKDSPLKASNILDHSLVSNLTIEELEKLYVEFHREAEERPEMEEEARKWFKKLEDGDPEAKAIWQVCVDISLREFERIYDLLGVKIDYAYGESFYLDKMNEVLQDCREKGILKKSEGAWVVEIPGMKLPAMLVKSDGATTYLLRDLAAIKFRIKTWQPDLIVYEVGADQTMHFQQLFNIATQLGYGNLNMFVHVAHGLIRWPTGKFSTRKGETIHLEEVLNEAIRRARQICKRPENSGDIAAIDYAVAGKNETCWKDKEAEEQHKKESMVGAKSVEEEEIAKAVGIGAIKYNDLKQNPRTDIIFDWDQILTLSGNSGPYLQYTYARTQSVLKKAKFSIFNFQFLKSEENFELSSEEISVLRTIYKFPETIKEAAEEFSPNLLCNFLFDLAHKFNLFYDKHRILSTKFKIQNSKSKYKNQNENETIEKQSAFRLLLTAAVGQVLKNGLTLLGIKALQRM